MHYWHWVTNLRTKPATTGFPTETDDRIHHMLQGEVRALGSQAVNAPACGFLRRSLQLRHVDTGSCNGCESELSMLGSPDYDLSRYGFGFTPSPKHADLLVVTGVVTRTMAEVLARVYQQMTAPKKVVAIGICAISGGVFAGADGVLGSLDGIVPVDVSIDGCPPSPGDILRGLLWAVDGRDPLASDVGRG